MAVITNMDMIRLVIADPQNAPMPIAQIVTEEIKEFKESERYKMMVEAEQYYLNKTEIRDKKTNENPERSNVKIEHPLAWKLVKQKQNYLLSKSWTVNTQDAKYGDALNMYFDRDFRRKIRSFGGAVVKAGIAWLQPYFGESGTLKFMRIPATEVVPIWNDEERQDLWGFIRFYEQTVYAGNKKMSVSRAELWTADGVMWFVTDPHTSGQKQGDFRIDKEHGDESTNWTEPHFMVDGKPFNWSIVPIVWAKYNDDEISLIYFIKSLIDDINWQTSVTSDVLRDVCNFVWVIRNYGGADPDEFAKKVREAMAINVTGDGGVDKLEPSVNIDAVMAFLDKQRRDTYDFAASVDTKDPDLGSASGTAINFRYMDLDSDCAALGMELNSAFQRMKVFLDVYFQVIRTGDFTNSEFDVVFNADMPVNETDVINNARTSEGMLSKLTILKNHPWVVDAEEEMAALEKEKEEAMEKFAGGMFDSAFNPGQNQQPAPGVKENGDVTNAQQ